MSTISASTTSTTAYKVTADTTGTLVLQTGSTPTTAVTIDGSQNVGVGTSSPAYRLDVNGVIRGRSDQYFGWVNGSQAGVWWSQTNYAVPAFQGLTSAGNVGDICMQPGGGNLLVGGTSSLAKITINGGDGDQLALNNAGSQYTSMYYRNNGTNKVSLFWDNTAARYYITPPTGGVYLANGGTSWTASSDERVKDVIEPIENAVEKLSGWRTVIGKYKTDEDGVRRSFLMAQDVLATFPEAVDATNSEEYGLRYQDTIPVLVKAIQEQQAIIETLTNRITALEAK
jgi:hypothetical protein